MTKQIILFEFGADGGGASVIKLPNATIIETGSGGGIEYGDEDPIRHWEKHFDSWEAWWQAFTSTHKWFWIFFYPIFIHEEIKPFIQNAVKNYDYPDVEAGYQIEIWNNKLISGD